jgi:endonuclease/exonuclease/phosphatase family metal-dependent hydrolase
MRIQDGALLMLAMLAMIPAGSGRAEVAESHVRVMSFNIRFGTASDGENHWERRKEFLVETIRAFDPDLLGTQETLAFQRDYLAEALPGYGWLGVGRDDGREAGEMMALYYRQSRFEKLDGGHFWLSETPEKAASVSWDSSLPRMVTWVKLHDRLAQDGPALLFLNTHFDHRGHEARLESSRLLRRKVEELGSDCRIILTGDFNAGEASPPYEALFATVEGRESPLVDTYRTVHPEHQADEGTFTAFRASATSGPRIDWIGVSRDWEILEAHIDRTERDGRTPSDHCPVTTVLRPR